MRISGLSILCFVSLYLSPVTAAEPSASRKLLDKIRAASSLDAIRASDVILNDGQEVKPENLPEIYNSLNDADKQRLELPAKPEDFNRGMHGVLASVSRRYDLHIRISDPKVTTLQTIDSNGNPVTLQVKMLQYGGRGPATNRLCGEPIVVSAGLWFSIHLHNALLKSESPVLDWTAGMAPPAGQPWLQDAPAVHQSLFATNLHTHGLHVFPGGHSDNVSLVCEARAGAGAPATHLPLVYYLRSDHIAGTFWYHPHLHGNVAYQVANGMAGALIVQGDPLDRSLDLDDLPEIAAANVPTRTFDGKIKNIGRILTLQQFALSEAKAVDGSTHWLVNPEDVNDRRIWKPTDPMIPNFTGNKLDVTTVNGGSPLSRIEMQPGQIERWRMIHAGKEGAIPLKWYRLDGTQFIPVSPNDPELVAVRIAEDGIPCLDTNDKDQYVNHALAQNELTMYPGYRSDLLIQPTKVGEYYLMQEETPRAVPRKLSKLIPAQFLARIVVKGTSMNMSLPKLADVKKCVPSDIVIPPGKTPDQSIAFEFVDTEQFGVNGFPWASSSPPIEQVLGRAERWRLSVNVPAKVPAGGVEPTPPVQANVDASGIVKHPFHIHVNPFQVENYPRPGRNMWKDTFAFSRDDGDVFVRIQANDITGESVLHCHTLDHEDQGMMRRILIRPPVRAAQLFPAAERRTVAASLHPRRDSRVVIVFSGPSCEQCNESLKTLQSLLPLFDRYGTDVTAISRDALDEGFKLQGISISDANHSGNELKSITRQADLPSHAAYIVDKSGKVRYEYEGNHPLQDPSELLRSLRELGSR